ncbi:MAG: response regulator [Lawsonibacter sp.]|nr:response regulator [Lawsonibacter sp.]
MERDKVIILSIDDDKQIRYSLKALFATQGWETLSAEDVKAGLRLFHEYHPDLVLIDYHMPDVNGILGVQMLRALSQDVPIIVFTIDESQKVADDFLSAGATDFALKPIKAPDLISRICLHLRLVAGLRQNVHQTSSFVTKGIGEPTLELIRDYFYDTPGFLTADAIAKGTGLAYQTVYRYLQYLIKEKQVEVRTSYGKIGRPRQSYCLSGN